MERYLTPKEVMKALNISKSTAYALINRADFPTIHIGKRLYVSESAFVEWLNAGGTVRRESEV